MRTRAVSLQAGGGVGTASLASLACKMGPTPWSCVAQLSASSLQLAQSGFTSARARLNGASTFGCPVSWHVGSGRELVQVPGMVKSAEHRGRWHQAVTQEQRQQASNPWPILRKCRLESHLNAPQ